MPTGSRREDDIVERILSAYEGKSWADADIEWLDKTTDGAVEARATRRSDGRTVAVEHTIIEPFVGDKRDFASFQAFLRIEEDNSLLMPERWISLFVPVGTLHGHKESFRRAIVTGVHDWLRAHCRSLSEGFKEHSCDIEITGSLHLRVPLYTRVIPLLGKGALQVRRQQVDENLAALIEKAIKNKLPKLVRTVADRHMLLLERQHMNLYPSRIMEEVEKLKDKFPDSAKVEVWIVETMFYERESYLRFERFLNGKLKESLNFLGTRFIR